MIMILTVIIIANIIVVIIIIIVIIIILIMLRDEETADFEVEMVMAEGCQQTPKLLNRVGELAAFRLTMGDHWPTP